VLVRTGRVEEAVGLQSLSGVHVGANEFLIEASPSLERAGGAFVVTILVFRDGREVAQRSFRSERAAPIAGTFVFEIEAGEGEAHGH